MVFPKGSVTSKVRPPHSSFLSEVINGKNRDRALHRYLLSVVALTPKLDGVAFEQLEVHKLRITDI
jgi:hypothetical protein